MTDHENSVTNQSRSFDTVSVTLGGDVHLSDSLRLGGTLLRTERAPTTEELFSNGPHLATNQFEVGDINLNKEVATGVEAALRYKQAGRFVTLNAYYTDYEDYIFETQTGLEEDGLPVFLFVGEDTTFKGFELQAGTTLGQLGSFDLSTDALLEYVEAETDTENLPRIPPLSILAGLEAQNDNLLLRAELDYADSQTDIAPNELPTDDYLLTNFFVTWTVPQVENNVKFRLALLNAFDKEARQHTSFLKDVAPLPGRNVRLSISADF